MMNFVTGNGVEDIYAMGRIMLCLVLVQILKVLCQLLTIKGSCSYKLDLPKAEK
jgi:hypothetical protein